MAALPSSPGKGLFRADLFAKAAAPPGLAQRTSAHPFVIVANESLPGPSRQTYGAADENAFFDRLHELNVLATDGGMNFWVDIDLTALSPDRYDDLCKNFLGLHDVTQRDCIVEDTTVTDTKVSMFANYLFLIVDTLLHRDAKGEEWETRNLNIILYERACVTLHNGPMPGPAAILSRVNEFHARRLPSAKWVQCVAFDILVESLILKIDNVCRDVEMIDQNSVPDDLLTANHDDAKQTRQGTLLRDIRVARKRLGKLRSSLSSKMETIEYLLQRSPSSLSSFSLSSSSDASASASPDRSMFHHLRAAASEVKWKMARIVAAQETLHGAHQNYLAFVSVQASKINNQANSVLKRITVLLALTTPLNLIASIFGMNVFPLTTVTISEDGDESNTLFILLLLVMFLSSLMLLATARWYRWL